MRKTFLSIIFLIILLLVPTMVFAAEGTVAQVGKETFENFEEALEAAKTSGEDLVILETLYVGKKTTINIEGINITGEVNPLFVVEDGYSTIEGNGTISAPNGDAFHILGNYNSDYETVAISSGLKIGADVKVIAKDNCIYIRGNAATADVYGSLTSTKKECAVIQGNGQESSGKTVINIYDGASVVHTDGDAGIYHPQPGKVNVYGGTIKGATGIEMRAGELLVEGGTIIGTAVPLEVTSNGNGSTSYGAGIAVAQHTTKLDTSVVVNGGIIQGYSALYQSNPENNEAEAIDKISIEVNGGTFETINEGTVVVYSENNTEFIYRGTFNGTVNADYLVEGVTSEKDANGNYVVGTRYDVVIKETTNGKVTASVKKALAGEKVKLTISEAIDYELSKLTVLNADNNEVEINKSYEFIMPAGGVTITAEFTKIPPPETDYIITGNETENSNIGVVETEKTVETLQESLKADTKLNEKVEEEREKGNQVTVEITMEELDKDSVKEEVKQKILQTVAANQKVHQYFDISVLVRTNEKELGKLTQLTEKMKFSMEISKDLIKEGRKFYIINLHGDEVNRIEATLNGTKLEFETEKFSTFALAYEDGEAGSGVPGEQQPSEENNNVVPPVSEGKDDTPKTGIINIPVYVWLSIAVMALVGIATTKKQRSKHSK